MNPSLAVLITILFVLLAASIFLIIRMWVLSIKNQKQLIILPDSSKQCSPNIDLLPDVSSLKACTNPGLQYRGTIYYPKYDAILSPAQVPYQNVCISACGANGVSTNGTCKTSSFQDAYDECITLLQPNNCTSLSNPLGHIDDTYYYANYFGEGNCFV